MIYTMPLSKSVNKATHLYYSISESPFSHRESTNAPKYLFIYSFTMSYNTLKRISEVHIIAKLLSTTNLLVQDFLAVNSVLGTYSTKNEESAYSVQR